MENTVGIICGAPDSRLECGSSPLTTLAWRLPRDWGAAIGPINRQSFLSESRTNEYVYLYVVLFVCRTNYSVPVS